MSEVLIAGPDLVVNQLLSSVVKWEQLVVMLNHQPDAELRSACVHALSALLLRSDDPFRVRFLRSHGFALLANQLREFPVTQPIADCLFSLLCGETLRLDDGSVPSACVGK